MTFTPDQHEELTVFLYLPLILMAGMGGLNGIVLKPHLHCPGNSASSACCSHAWKSGNPAVLTCSSTTRRIIEWGIRVPSAVISSNHSLMASKTSSGVG